MSGELLSFSFFCSNLRVETAPGMCVLKLYLKCVCVKKEDLEKKTRIRKKTKKKNPSFVSFGFGSDIKLKFFGGVRM